MYSRLCMCDVCTERRQKKQTNKKQEEKQTQKQTRFKCKAQSALIRSPGNIPASKLARVARA